MVSAHLTLALLIFSRHHCFADFLGGIFGLLSWTSEHQQVSIEGVNPVLVSMHVTFSNHMSGHDLAHIFNKFTSIASKC